VTPKQAAVILGVSKPWTLEDIKKAYRQRSRILHPDMGGTDGAFNELSSARECLEEYLNNGGRPDGLYASGVWYGDVEDEPRGGQEPEPEVVDDDWLPGFGSLFEVHLLYSDGLDIPALSARLMLVDHEALILVSLEAPISSIGSMVSLFLSEPGTGQIVRFDRDIRQQSYDVDGNVSAIWVGLFEEPTYYDPKTGTWHDQWPVPKRHWYRRMF
jgi:hypothetical protein